MKEERAWRHFWGPGKGENKNVRKGGCNAGGPRRPPLFQSEHRAESPPVSFGFASGLVSTYRCNSGLRGVTNSYPQFGMKLRKII